MMRTSAGRTTPRLTRQPVRAHHGPEVSVAGKTHCWAGQRL